MTIDDILKNHRLIKVGNNPNGNYLYNFKSIEEYSYIISTYDIKHRPFYYYKDSIIDGIGSIYTHYKSPYKIDNSIEDNLNDVKRFIRKRYHIDYGFLKRIKTFKELRVLNKRYIDIIVDRAFDAFAHSLSLKDNEHIITKNGMYVTVSTIQSVNLWFNDNPLVGEKSARRYRLGLYI